MRVEVLLAGATIPTSSGNLSTSTVTLIDHPTGPVLIDCAAWNQRRALLAELAARSLTPRDIATVAFTHLHWDHCMNFDLFDRSRLLVPASEWRRLAHATVDSATPAYLRSLLGALKNVEFFDPGPILDQVLAIATPGHTDGHVAFVVHTTETLVIAGDAVPTREAARVGIPHLVFGDGAEARRSVSEVLAAGDVVIPGHDIPFRGQRDEFVFGVPTASKEGHA